MSDALRVRVVPLSDLSFQPDGPTRGYAHARFIPPGTMGHLDFGPLMLVAVGEMRSGEEVPLHRHEAVENLSLVSAGRLEHRDDLGTACTLGPGGVSNLSAGRGVQHRERVVGDETVHAAIIWVAPWEPGALPRYQTRSVPMEARRDRLVLLASGRHPGVLPISQDAAIHGAVLSRGAAVVHRVEPRRRAYAVSLGGAIQVAGHHARSNERVLVEGEGALIVTALAATELLVIDLAA